MIDPVSYYQSRFSYDQKRSGVWKVICRYLQSYVPPRGRVLDMGAGYCDFINHIQAGEKHALDLYPHVSDYANTDVQTHVGPCMDLSSFPDDFFDVVFESNLLEHLTRSETERTLGEVRRVLKSGGRFLAIQPNYYYCYRMYFDDYTHLQVFSHTSLADLLTANAFQVEKVEPRFLPTTLKSRLPSWPWMVELYLRLPFRPWAGQMFIASRLQA